MKNLRKLLFLGLMMVVLLAALGWASRPVTLVRASTTFELKAPRFVNETRTGTASLASIIEDEAGISAYFQASTSISLDDVRDVFRTIEVETTDYIIGSVAVINYPESEDVHVYVHVDGWILAYYLAADPVGKIFDWRDYHDGGQTDITTKLENTLVVVAGEAGVPFTDATYYDFRNPNATHLMLIAEWIYNSSDSFEINTPGSFAYYERSWSLGSNGYGSYELDGVTIKSHSTGWNTSQGTLTAAQLLPDQFHTIYVREESGSFQYYIYGGLALIYRVP